MPKPRKISNILLLIKRTSLFFVMLTFFSFAIYTYTRLSDTGTAHAATASTLNFQARLLTNSGGVVPDGFYNIEFKLYDGGTSGGPAGQGEANAGTLLWTETRDYAGTDDRVRVVNGYLSVNLGSVNTALMASTNWDQEHWLTMSVRGATQCTFATDCTPADGEMLAPGSKRTKLTAVPYAFTAGQLRKTVGANSSILDFLNPTGSRVISLPDQSGTLCIQGSADCIDVVTTGTTANTSSSSGLEISADGLRLLGGCSDGQLLLWDGVGNDWQCSTSSGTSFTVRESDGSPSTTVSTALEFGPAATSSDEFVITAQGGGVTRVRIGNGVALLADNEAVTGAWTYSADQTLNLDDGEDLAINLAVLGIGNAQAETITLTNNSIMGNQYGLYIDNATALGTTDALVVLDNSDAINAVTAAIKVINGGGGFTNLFDIAGTLITTSEFTVLSGGLSETEISGEIEAVTAGNGLAGGGTADSVSLSIASTNGAIVVGSDDVTFTLAAAADGLSATTSSGSGLEVLASGLSLLQGCANNEGLSWNETSDVWACSLETLDSIYAKDTDKQLSVTNASGLTYDLTTTGGLFIEDNGTVFASFTDTGGIIFQPGATSAVTFTLDDNSAFIQNGTVTNTGFLQDINLTFGADGGVDTVSALNIDVTSASDVAGDVVHGLNIGNLTGNGANTSERALRIGTGWSSSNGDADLVFDDETPVIRLGATDNTAVLSINDAAATPNNLLLFKDLSTNFGASLETGALIDRNSYIGEEFSRARTAIAGDTASVAGGGTWGDEQAWQVDEQTNATNDCQALMPTDIVNGITQLQNDDVNTTCNMYHSTALGNLNLLFDVDNLPVALMKVRPSHVSASDDLWVGFQDQTQLTTNDEPDQGVFFTNADGGTWTGVVKTTDVTRTAVVCTGQTVSTTQFALLKIEVISSTNIRFYVDNDVSNGIQWFDCGSATTGVNIPTAGLSSMLKWSSTTITRQLNTDFFRVWQDDSAIQTEEVGSFMSSQDSSDHHVDPLQLDVASPRLNNQAILSDLMLASENMQYGYSQQLDAGLVIASEGLVTPQVTTDSLLANTISPSSGNDLTLNLDQTGALVIKDNNAAEVVRIDGQGNAAFTGSVIADTLRVNHLELEGVNYFEPIDELKMRLASLEARPATVIDPRNLDLSSLEVGSITVIGQATFKQAARFEKDAQFDANVEVKGELKTNADTAGTIKIEADKTTAEIKFIKPKSSKPIVHLSLGDGKFTQYSYRNVTEEGFEIVLAKPTTEELEFSWIAIQSAQSIVQAP